MPFKNASINFLDELSKDFAALTQTGQDEVVEQAAFANTVLLVGLAVILLFISTMFWAIGRSITQPIIALTRSMQTLAKGDLDAAIPTEPCGDEIGTMLLAVRAFKDSMMDADGLRGEQGRSKLVQRRPKCLLRRNRRPRTALRSAHKSQEKNLAFYCRGGPVPATNGRA